MSSGPLSWRVRAVGGALCPVPARGPGSECLGFQRQIVGRARVLAWWRCPLGVLSPRAAC